MEIHSIRTELTDANLAWRGCEHAKKVHRHLSTYQYSLKVNSQTNPFKNNVFAQIFAAIFWPYLNANFCEFVRIFICLRSLIVSNENSPAWLFFFHASFTDCLQPISENEWRVLAWSNRIKDRSILLAALFAHCLPSGTTCLYPTNKISTFLQSVKDGVRDDCRKIMR